MGKMGLINPMDLWSIFNRHIWISKLVLNPLHCFITTLVYEYLWFKALLNVFFLKPFKTKFCWSGFVLNMNSFGFISSIYPLIHNVWFYGYILIWVYFMDYHPSYWNYETFVKNCKKKSCKYWVKSALIPFKLNKL